MYKLFLCLRYLFKRRIAIFAMLAVCLCVAMVLTVISIMGGFLNMVRDHSRGMLSDLIVESATLQGFPFYGEFIDRLKKEMPGEIEEATPLIITYGVLRFPRTSMTKTVQVVGIKLEETYRVNEFKGGLFYEKYYPGTTTFDKQREPYLGGTRDGVALPPELESARRRWEAGATREEINEAWRASSRAFEMPAGDFPGELNKGILSSELRQAFEERVKLPDEVQVEVARKGKKWLVRLPFGLYTIERDHGKLQVDYSLYAGPGRFADPAPELFREGPGWRERAIPGIILGTDLCAERLKTGGYDRFCSRGEMVQLSVVPFSDKGVIESGTGMQNMLLRYVDDCRTGVYDIDSNSVYVDFDRLQDTVNMTAYVWTDPSKEGSTTAPAGGSRPAGPEVPARATQVQIKLNPSLNTPEKVGAARDRVKAIWDKVVAEREDALRGAPDVLERIEGPVSWVKVQTWVEKQARYTAAVEKEKYLVTILFAVISLVAVVLVGVIFHMIVQQKTRDIGIIKSVGATSMGVAGIFLSYAAAVGIVGGAAGTLLGSIIVWRVNDIQDGLIWIFGPSAQVWNPEVYAFDFIPNQVSATDALVIYVVAIVASMVGSLIAAWKAARVWPVESLRYE